MKISFSLKEKKEEKELYIFHYLQASSYLTSLGEFRF